jgi:hypothetical protein
MPIDMSWYDDAQRIVYIRILPPWTWVEFSALQERSVEMIDRLPYRICYMVDLTQVLHLPMGLPLTAIYPVLEASHRNSDAFVIVGAKPSVEKILRTLLRATRLSTHITLVGTLDEGLHVIAARRDEINRSSSSSLGK